MKPLCFIICLLSFAGRSMDTVFVHPKYPPLVYEGREYTFYKYTAKYVPQDLFQAFKILGTFDQKILQNFTKRTEEQVVKHGMHQKGFRIRKEFCLDGYSSFTTYFHQKGIYYPYAMKTYVLLCFHQYLNCEKIRWHQNKRTALLGKKELNKAWKKRLKHVFNPIILDEEPNGLKNPVMMTEEESMFYSN